MMVAALLLLARLIAPAAAMPASPADSLGWAGLQTLCHGAGSEAPSDPAPAPADCLLCPACQLTSHAAIPLPEGPVLRLPAPALVARAAPLPPATAPPERPRAVPQPTGPPSPPV